MIKKLFRNEYYDDDYVLNEQEYKEFNFSKIDPYWKIRFHCYSFSLNVFGDKYSLIRRIEEFLFYDHNQKKPLVEPDIFDIDLEVLVKNGKFTTGNYDLITFKQLESNLHKEPKIMDKTTRYNWPWDVVVELAKMNKRLSYSDVYKGITHLMRSNMIFYNHFLENETLCAIVYLPFSPKNINYLSPDYLFVLNKVLEMKINYETISNCVDLYKQKLLDLFYFIEDCDKLHGVLHCQSFQKNCNNLSSQFCSNFLCKICCQNLQCRLPCIMHDSYDQFFRHKIYLISQFEIKQNYDPTRTIRLQTRRLIRKYDLERIFCNLGINWERLGIFYHNLTSHIQFIYLEFQTQKQAEIVYLDRKNYESKLEKFDLTIAPLNEWILKSNTRFTNLENMICIIKPLTTLEIMDELPSDEGYLQKIVGLLENITELSCFEFKITEDINKITGSTLRNHLYITFPNPSYVDRVYNAQPLFGCLLVHKMSHNKICPFIKYNYELCLVCENPKNKTCLLDLCKKCCSKQKFKILNCDCGIESLSLVKINEENNLIENKYCEICKVIYVEKCANNLCETCCKVQFERLQCEEHEKPIFLKNILKIPPNIFARKILTLVSECNIRLKHELKNGRYDWFRPIYETNLQDSMVKANKELQIVIDSSSFQRGSNTTKYKKEGKIFTFQANEPISIWITPKEKFLESIDHKGDSFVEYFYGENVCLEGDKIWVKNNPTKFRTYSIEEYDQFINSPNLQIRNNFHLMLIGLDKNNLNIRDLYQEIQNKLKNQVGRIDMKNILIIDNESLITDIYNSQIFEAAKNLEENLYKMGRVACVKFDNILDGLALFTNEVKINLPLNTGKNDQPIIYPSKSLMKFIDEFNPLTTPISMNDAGFVFSKLNEEIDLYNSNIRNFINKDKLITNNYGNKRKFSNNKNGPPQQGSKRDMIYKKLKK